MAAFKAEYSSNAGHYKYVTITALESGENELKIVRI
jgi:hypothetical protein